MNALLTLKGTSSTQVSCACGHNLQDAIMMTKGKNLMNNTFWKIHFENFTVLQSKLFFLKNEFLMKEICVALEEKSKQKTVNY